MTAAVRDSSGASRSATSAGAATSRPSLSAAGTPAAPAAAIYNPRANRSVRRPADILVVEWLVRGGRIEYQAGLARRRHCHAIFLARFIHPAAHGFARGIVEHALRLRLDDFDVGDTAVDADVVRQHHVARGLARNAGWREWHHALDDFRGHHVRRCGRLW